MPKISVIMPVYNAQRYLRRAIDSILAQSFTDFEFLILNDASTDNTESILNNYSDSRIRYINNEQNIGVARSLNRGLRLARGEYIARMDADDVSLKKRFSQQVKYLSDNASVGIVGTWIRLFGDQLPLIEQTPTGSSNVAAYMVFDNPIYHPTVMLRRSLIEEYGLSYNSLFNRTEDYELWSRAVKVTLLDNLPMVLHKMRHHKKSVTSTCKEAMTRQTCELLAKQLQRLEVITSDEKIRFHHDVGRGKRIKTRKDVHRAEKWLNFIRKKNMEVGIYDEKTLDIVLGMIWFRICRNSTPLGLWMWRKYRQFSVSKSYVPAKQQILFCLFSILLHAFKRT